MKLLTFQTLAGSCVNVLFEIGKLFALMTRKYSVDACFCLNFSDLKVANDNIDECISRMAG